MIGSALRLFMLRFLPRRLVPFLALVEFLLMIRRMRRKQPDMIVPRRLVTADGPRDVTPTGAQRDVPRSDV